MIVCYIRPCHSKYRKNTLSKSNFILRDFKERIVLPKLATSFLGPAKSAAQGTRTNITGGLKDEHNEEYGYFILTLQ